jgi:hypothetical protein
MTAAEVFAAVDATQVALDALTDESPGEVRAEVEAAHRAASDAMFELL